MLLELDVEVVGAAAVLLHRADDPVPKRRAWYGLNSMLTFATMLYFVQDQDHVGLVVDGRRAAQVVVAEPGGLEALLVRRDDRDRRELLGQGDVLEPADDVGDLLGLRRRPGIWGTFWR